jgi:hypothetical protein
VNVNVTSTSSEYDKFIICIDNKQSIMSICRILPNFYRKVKSVKTNSPLKNGVTVWDAVRSIMYDPSGGLSDAIPNCKFTSQVVVDDDDHTRNTIIEHQTLFFLFCFSTSNHKIRFTQSVLSFAPALDPNQAYC